MAVFERITGGRVQPVCVVDKRYYHDYMILERSKQRVSEDRIRALVFSFYDRVRADALLGPIFEDRLEARWDSHLERMCDFWSTVLNATGRYRGDPIGTHADLPDIEPRHFDRWMDLFERTAREIMEPGEVEDVLRRSRRMREVLQSHRQPSRRV